MRVESVASRFKIAPPNAAILADNFCGHSTFIKRQDALGSERLKMLFTAGSVSINCSQPIDHELPQPHHHELGSRYDL